MEIFSDSDLTILPFAGRISFPEHSLTLLVKATFDISHKQIALLADEQTPATADEFYPDDKAKSGTVYYASDFAYYKPAADILLSAKCHTPNGKAINACPVSIQVGDYKKSLNVTGNRYWEKILFSPKTTEAKPFTEMDLRYERSFGGEKYKLNPVGRGATKDDVTIADNVLPVPNIQSPDNLINSPFSKSFPAGFSPLHPNWETRQSKLGSPNKHYLKNRWPWFPEDFDWSHFNAAPSDQQIEGYLRGDEKLILENLNRRYPRFEAQLPGIRPRAFTRKVNKKTKKRYFDEVKLKLDTLWIDMEKQKLVLCWRGWTEVEDEDFEEVKQLFLMQEKMNEPKNKLETCYAAFKQAQAAEAAEFKKPETPKPVSKKGKFTLKQKALSAGGVAASIDQVAASESNALSNTSFGMNKNQIKLEVQNTLTAMGFSLDMLPAETQLSFNEEQDKLFEKMLDTTHHEETINTEVDEQINSALADVGLDLADIPKADTQSIASKNKMLESLGLNPDNAADYSGFNEFWGIFSAALIKTGIPADNIIQLMTQTPQFEKTSALLKNLDKPANPLKEKNNKIETSIKPPPKDGIYAGEDYSDHDFSNQDLTGTDFTKAILNNANFDGANLSKAIFLHSNLAKANFSNAKIRFADFSNADVKQGIFANANLDNCTLKNTNFEGIKAENSSWRESDATDAIFVDSTLIQADFSSTNCNGTDFEGADVCGANFSNAMLTNATFERSKAIKTQFFKANISGLRASQKADFSGANFSQSTGKDPIFLSAIFKNADLTYCDLPGANFNNADLSDADLSGANLKHSRFIKANLSNSKIIESNLMQASMERANLFQADLRASNCYEVEFLGAQTAQMKSESTVLTATKLE